MAKQSGSPGHMKPGQQGQKNDDMKRQGGSPGQQHAEGGDDRQQGAGQQRGGVASDKMSEAGRKGGKS